MKEKFYITTPIYYANGVPHIGHAYTTIKADVFARWKRELLGKENVFFSVGMDEHGLKIQNQAEKDGKSPQELVDDISCRFSDLWKSLDISFNGFIRTTCKKHKKATEKVLERLYEKGDIYKGIYKGLYCVGCEQFITKSQLVDGKCPEHDQEPEIVEEDNYLLKMTELQEEIVKKIELNDLRITPKKRKNEILSFLKKQKLNDISISRPKEKVSWGISLPFDNGHVAYVWVDAFLNYLTVLCWKGDPKKVSEFFPPNIQFLGKDILRVHATIWPAILIHLGLPLPHEIYTHGHILSGGKKMSKTLGNVVDPTRLIDEYGKDVLRYYLMRYVPSFEDGEITYDRFYEVYNADLANGLGNLTSRILKMSENYFESNDLKTRHLAIWSDDFQKYVSNYSKFMSTLEFNSAIEVIWLLISDLDRHIQETEPFKVAKTDLEKAKDILSYLIGGLIQITIMLKPIMPETSEKIKKAIQANKMPKPLFLRK